MNFVYPVYRFWKKCCEAFVEQCLQKNLILQAVPYLLAIHQSNEAIEHLCEQHFYREAWCVAISMKVSEDPIFASIATRWVQYLDDTGNLEAAALM